MPYAELCHYEFTSGGREEVNEEKLRRWKRAGAVHAALAGALPQR